MFSVPGTKYLRKWPDILIVSLPMDVYIFSEHTLNAYGCIFSGCIFSVHTTEKKTEFCHRNLLKIVLQIVIQIFSYPFEQSGTDSWCRLRYAVCCARACVWESKRECVFRKKKSSYPPNRAAPTPGAACDTSWTLRGESSPKSPSPCIPWKINNPILGFRV